MRRGLTGTALVAVFVLGAVAVAAVAPAGAWSVTPAQGLAGPTAPPVSVGEEPLIEGPLPAAEFGDPEASSISQTAPWLAAGPDLALAGYVEEEFLITSGSSTTRLLVRRPTTIAAFSGTALVEWQNADAGFDLDAVWTASSQLLTTRGHAWVGVTVSPVAAAHLRSWSPARYGALSVDETAAATALDDVATALLRSYGLLGELRPTQLLAVGARGAAGALADVVTDRAAKSTARATGPPAAGYYDGYAFVVGPAPAVDPGVPVLHVLSELDATILEPRPDGDRYRRWEVAGTAPASVLGELGAEVALLRDVGAEALAIPTCDAPAPAGVPGQHVLRGAIDALVRWAAPGVPPANAPRLTRTADGVVVRDDLGNALGGIRLAAIAVPTAGHSGFNAGDGLCPLLGSTTPLDEETIAALYPSHDDYVRAATFVIARNLERGFVTVDDATASMVAAVRSDVGRAQQSSSTSE